MDTESYAGLTATMNELIENAERLRPILESKGLTLVGVNKYYKTHCAAIEEGVINAYSVYEYKNGHEIVYEGKLGYGYRDPWEGASNLVKVEDIGYGQLELF
ncbi:hypothetical protein J40TS1_34350 [Paenibacillus montaniterrae]|uniref:Uncharacterized protein n=1 Tax=Paenibacillus montaniterrae TaxID=429341 RepID=A0A919YVX8_9BACL|nr:hypothetical protein [Paenibacillus montaniterrae]GIP17793.1 hypothetical protein J40TS1_34350 [Paenibacillus montaniterrae]